MKRYDVDNTFDDGEMVEDAAGTWVRFDHAQAAIDAAVKEEREQWEYALRDALAGMRGLEELIHRA